MNTNFSLYSIWSQGDFISHLVTIILLSMSVTSWSVIALKVIALNRQRLYSHRIEAFWHSPSISDGLDALGRHKANVFFQVAEHSAQAVEHVAPLQGPYANTNDEKLHEAQLHDQLDLSDWVTRSLRNSVEVNLAHLQAGLASLASIGSTAPFIGLFGTVWGIYHALTQLGRTGQASLDQISGPIGEALIMTALGLAVAIPAVLGYNALLRSTKKIGNNLNRFAYDLHAFYVTGTRVKNNQIQELYR